MNLLDVNRQQYPLLVAKRLTAFSIYQNVYFICLCWRNARQ